MTILDELRPRERRALRPPERLTVSEWADRHRSLPPWVNRPGQWETDWMPPLREIMDCVTDRRVEKVCAMCAAQIGKTEALLNILGYTFDQDPAMTLVVMSSEDTAKDLAENRVKVMFDCSPTLRALRTGRKTDWRTDVVKTDQMAVHFAWANSPSQLASRAVKRVFLDEVDKYPPSGGREADPVSLALERLTTFHDSLAFLSSTPTNRNGLIWREWCASDRRRYHVPCPHCRTFQHLEFGQLEWGGERDPERIVREDLAFYRCAACRKEIREDRKLAMVREGVWVPEGAAVDSRGRVTGNLRSPHRGYHLSRLYVPWITWSRVAAQFVRTKDDHEGRKNFTNSWLGWIYEEVTESIGLERVAALGADYEPGTVPDGGEVLTAGADTQKDQLYYEIRAWGTGERSWLVEAGRCGSFDELGRLLFERRFPTAAGEQLPVTRACIDSGGHRTHEVYAFCHRWGEVAVALKGRAATTSAGKFLVHRLLSESDAPGLAGTHFSLADVDHFKNHLHRLMMADGCWHFPRSVPDAWLRQMASEHRVPIKRGGRIIETWQRKVGAPDNHWWDCAVYSLVAAELIGVRALEDPPAGPDPGAPRPAPPQRIPGRRTQGGWLNRRRRR